MKRLLLAGGLVLVLAGAAAVGVVGYSLLGGDESTQQAQEQLAAEFTAGPATSTTSTTTPPANDDPTMVGAVTTTTAEDLVGLTTTTVPGLVLEPAPARGEVVGRIRIPAIAVDWMIVEGVTLDLLAQGPGHMPGTAMPGQVGNAVISGHRTTHGAPFFRLDALLPGNRITVETTLGEHVYEVVEVRIVAPDAIWVTRQVPGAWLTLTACHPLYRSIERIVVFGRLVAGPNYEAIDAALTGEEAPPRPPEG